jgi:hypothetical protein
MRQVPNAILALLILLPVLFISWVPLGVERRAGGTREYLGITDSVIVGWNHHNLSLRGDETIVFNQRFALIRRWWVFVPLLLTVAASYLVYRVLKAGRPHNHRLQLTGDARG